MSEDHPVREHSKHNLAVEVLQKTGVLRLTAFGYSMLPTLFPGDILTVKAELLPAIQTGDVVLFTRQGRFFIHRCAACRLLQPRCS
jgi:phage repressor protein C with HTH and peptisase S24 domain